MSTKGGGKTIGGIREDKKMEIFEGKFDSWNQKGKGVDTENRSINPKYILVSILENSEVCFIDNKIEGSLNFEECPYIMEMLCEGEIVQYGCGRNEDNKEGEINMQLVPEFNRLQLKRGGSLMKKKLILKEEK